jgi:hypothetical protein
MSLLLYNAWQHDGSPFILCTPGQSLTATLTAHGYTVQSYPDQAHLTATPAEDHCPFSQTPWPGAQPYPHGMAIDIFGPNLAAVGAQIFGDTNADKPGTESIKYMNWTDSAGNCWHDKWEPNHVRTSSSDRGHIHISFRTDYVLTATGYDPVAAMGGDGMVNIPQEQWDALIWRDDAVIHDRPEVGGGPYKGEPNDLHTHLVAIDATLAEIKAAIAAIQGGTVDQAGVEAAAEKGAKAGIDGATIHTAG